MSSINGVIRAAMVINIHALMRALSTQRPIFHSEADFQHALAWAMHSRMPDADIRLEYKPISNERFYVDIWLRASNRAVAFELKYLTRRLNAQAGDEWFMLSQHGAHDLRRYDLVNDLVRLERITSLHPRTVGYAIVLANDPSYWDEPRDHDTVDMAFRLHEGRILTGELVWGATAGSGTTRNREQTLQLRDTYELHWSDYSRLGAERGATFRYLALQVENL